MNLKNEVYKSYNYRILNYLDVLFADNPRFSKVLKLRFGLDIGDYCEECETYKKGKTHSFEEVGKILESNDGTRVTREQIRQIESKGLRIFSENLTKLTKRDLMDFFITAPNFMLVVGVSPTLKGSD